MSLFEIVLLAIALGVDCLVVSFSQGLFIGADRLKNSLKLAITMGIFQGGMPLIGYLCANIVSSYVSAFTGWIVFGIFFALGAKFIIEAFKKEDDDEKICCINIECLISMGIATSIDAMGAGVSLSFSGANMLISVLLIGFASFLMSLTGFWFGNCFKHIPSKYLEIAGGLILIGLAMKAVL